MRRGMQPVVTILTGTRGAGKSRFCLSLARSHRGVAALVSPSCQDDQGRRFGIDALVFPGEARFPLARVVDPACPPRRASGRDRPRYTLAAAPREELPFPGVPLGPYLFSPAAFDGATASLRELLLRGGNRLVVLDEIGPLELERGEGFAALLGELLRGEGVPLLPLVVVVRPSLVGALRECVRRERGGLTPATIGVGEGTHPESSRLLQTLTGQGDLSDR
ncbi:hypothetical protein [Alkalispirochaeta sphaeroplastigenens]|nr:hypothetical protein [Alkalispirochaeta sphaeroplastigenens]